MTPATGPESLHVELVEPGAIPWADLAFPSVRFALERYLEDAEAGREELHFTTIDRRAPRTAPLGSQAGPVAK